MAVYTARETSAGQAVGVNISSGARWQVAGNYRVLRRLALTGSAAAGDAAIDLFIGNLYVGTYYNTSTGTAPVEAKDYIKVDYVVEPGEPINCIISDAGATNVLQVAVEMEDM